MSESAVDQRLSPVSYMKNLAKDALRTMIPAHRRFVRAGESFLRGGEREVHELPRLVEAGSTAVDVGAHIGDYTYSLCRAVGSAGRVIAVEPLPDLARLLTRATEHLGLPVTVVNCALSSKDGEADLLIPTEHGRRKAGYSTLERRDVEGKTCRVAVRKLDDVCRDVSGRISFIKIDVEGHELEVLRGAVDTLNRHHPNLLIEIEQRHSNVPIADTFAFVTGMGYRGEFLDADRNRQPLESFDPRAHQVRDADGSPSRDYVSNFIFRYGV
jgi:FkbM family methyltransferase